MEDVGLLDNMELEAPTLSTFAYNIPGRGAPSKTKEAAQTRVSHEPHCVKLHLRWLGCIPEFWRVRRTLGSVLN